MSSQLAASRVLELIENLKSTVQDLSSRAARLNEEYRAKISRERQRGQVALEESAAITSSGITQTEAEIQSRRAALEDHFARRKTRIGKAFQSSKEQRLREIDERLGASKYELQKRTLSAEKARNHAVAENHARFEQFKQQFGEQQQHLAELDNGIKKAFKGYGAFQVLLGKHEGQQPSQAADEGKALAALTSLLGQLTNTLAALRHLWLAGLFRYFIVWLLLSAGVFALPEVLRRSGQSALSYPQAAALFGGLALIIVCLRMVAQKMASSRAQELARGLHQAKELENLAYHLASTRHDREAAELAGKHEELLGAVDRDLKRANAKAGEDRVAVRMRADERTVKVTRRLEEMRASWTANAEARYQEKLRQIGGAGVERAAEVKKNTEKAVARWEAEQSAAWAALKSEWTTRVTPLYGAIKETQETASNLFPAWTPEVVEQWTPPPAFARSGKLADLTVDLPVAAGLTGPLDPQLPLPGPDKFHLPFCLECPDEGSVLIETDGSAQSVAVGALNNLILRLLSVAPPGRLAFTIFDPVGLGQNFAGVMHLADYEEQLIHSRIWTQSGQFEQKLGELNEHIEKVIQMYLRNEYRTIAEYNEQAGVIAEKYHFLVVADFPANFTETSAKRLLSIASSGAKCGVYTLIHWDRRLPLPQDFLPDDLRKSSIFITGKNGQFLVSGRSIPGLKLELESSPDAELATALVHKIGRSSRDSMRVEVPFEQVIPPEGEFWAEDTTQELRVPVGRTGATKLQFLEIGKGTRQHGLIAGKTGSGKSTLFHVIITNLALWCSPEQVEFYLVDFKKGVEFKCYASRKLPHARVVAIESDREFGLSVLQKLDDELRRRGDLFRKLGAQDLAGYKRAGGTEKLPRSLLIIDEFQEFFVEDDKVAQNSALLLDRIVRQGRAFGIHVLLGSQTLGGAYTMARTTLGQMVIRIALQCNEADAYLIMDDTNPAPRLLSRPGEGIYNDAAGALEGNSPFQVVWLPDNVRDSYLSRVREMADAAHVTAPAPVVFEGNAPSDVAENELLADLLQNPPQAAPPAGRIWLGAPNSIKGPTEAAFQPQSGNNLLIIGQREESALSILSLGLISLSAQYPRGTARFIFCDATPSGTPQRDYVEQVVRLAGPDVQLAKPGDLAAIMKELGEEQKQRAENAEAESFPPVFLFVHELQKFSRLRFEEDFGFSSGGDSEPSAGALFNSMLTEGTRLGFHVIASCDTFNNVNRFLSRKALSEFELRVLFQMSANDSASLIDSPRASQLGMHRALFYNAQEGYLETFRPYALPGSEWLENAGALVAGSSGKA